MAQIVNRRTQEVSKMKEAEIVLKTVAEALRTVAQGVTKIAQKVDDIALAQKAAAAKPKASKSRPRKAKTASGKVKSTKATSDQAKIYQIIARHKKGITSANIAKKTGFANKKVHNAVYKLKKQGKIKAIAKGVYVKA
jgi:predicted Rossmann fold nucleotide-binding protein DprA/Smf involved in DNA uptake